MNTDLTDHAIVTGRPDPLTHSHSNPGGNQISCRTPLGGYEVLTEVHELLLHTLEKVATQLTKYAADANVQLAPIPDARVAARHYFNFYANELLRPDVPSAELPDELSLRVLERLFRNRKPLSVVEALVLPRSKTHQSAGQEGVGDPSRAFRHVTSCLRRFLRIAGVPIHIHTHQGRIHTSFSPIAVRSNVIDAAECARAASHHLQLSNIREAMRRADNALAADPDCVRAAMVVAKVAQHCPRWLHEAHILRAGMSVGRAIMSTEAAIFRLNARVASGIPEFARAQRRALRYLTWLDRSWLVLRTIVQRASNYSNLVVAVVDTARAVARGARGTTFDHVMGASAMNTLVDHLLRGRVRDRNRARAATAEDLKKRIAWLLLVNGWLPLATSDDEAEQQLIEYLERRIDWPSVLNRSERRTLQYRDDLHTPDRARRSGAQERRSRSCT